MLSVSLFERFYNDPQNRFPATTLTRQYRMCPEIAEFVGHLAYKNHEQGTYLINNDNVQQQHPVDVQWTLLNNPLEQLGWKQTQMIGFSVDGQSTIYPRTTSWHNPSEVEAIAQYVQVLLRQYIQLKATGGDPSQAELQPTNIAVITPYTGQRRAVYRKLATMGLETVTVDTTLNAQGREFDIVLLSLVMNNPPDGKLQDMDVGWIKEKSQINVEFSRAKRAIAVFGNFKGWFVSRNSHGSKQHRMLNSRHFLAFRYMVDYFWDKKLVIRWDYAFKVFNGQPVKDKIFNNWVKTLQSFPPLPGASGQERKIKATKKGRFDTYRGNLSAGPSGT
jgi:superfamily I DNA and/or RNA helicase